MAESKILETQEKFSKFQTKQGKDYFIKFNHVLSVIDIFVQAFNLVCDIPRSFERSSPSDFRTQGSFIHINSRKIFERDLLSSDSVAKSATQKPWVF